METNSQNITKIDLDSLVSKNTFNGGLASDENVRELAKEMGKAIKSLQSQLDYLREHYSN